MIVAKVGERTYEFFNLEELSLAREVYMNISSDQNGFEDAMEAEGIDFTVEFL